MTAQVKEHVTESGTIYTYEERSFYWPREETPTENLVMMDQEAWWNYAGEEHRSPTLEERVELLESLVM